MVGKFEFFFWKNIYSRKWGMGSNFAEHFKEKNAELDKFTVNLEGTVHLMSLLVKDIPGDSYIVSYKLPHRFVFVGEFYEGKLSRSCSNH